jgi:hypothetical protein
MEASRLGFVRVDVAGDLVAISWHERAWLLEKIETLVGFESIVAKFHAVGASRPVLLDHNEWAHLRVPLEFWAETGELTDGLARLLAAIAQADPGAGPVSE